MASRRYSLFFFGLIVTVPILFAGCIGPIGSGPAEKRSDDGAAIEPELVGTWIGMIGYDNSGNLQVYREDTIVLEVTEDGKATYTFMETAPIEGVLVRTASRDSHYTTESYSAQSYWLVTPSVTLWEFVYVSTEAYVFFFVCVTKSSTLLKYC